MSQTSVWSFGLLPLGLLTLFLLVDPLLLNPSLYGLLAFCTGVAGLLLLVRNRPLKSPFLKIGLTAVVISLVSASLSGYFWNGFEYSIVLGIAILVGSTVPIEGRGNRDRVLFVVLLVLGIWVVAEMIAGYYRQVRLFGYLGFARLPLAGLGNPNVLARFLGLVGWGVVASARDRRWKWLSIPFFVFLCLASSRGAILAFLAGVFVWGLNKLSVPWDSRRVVFTGLVALVLITTFLVLFSTAPAKVTNTQRFNLLFESAAMIGEAPLTGVGPWNYGLVYPEVSLDDQWQRHPHSLPLWGLTAFGLGGALLVLAGLFAWDFGRIRTDYLPLLAFVGVHELVDTMVWIPGLLFLTVLLLLFAFKDGSSGRHRWLPAVLCVFLVVGGGLVWKTDYDFKRGLKAFDSGDYTRARSFWWNDYAGFTAAHRAVAFASEGNLDHSLKSMERALSINELDAYYRWLQGTLSAKAGKKSRAERFFQQYGKMDPYRMLTLKQKEGSRSGATRGNATRDVTFVELWLNQRKPRRYLPLVRESLETNQHGLAEEQIRFLLGLPKLTRQGRFTLMHYRSRLPGTPGATPDDTPDSNKARTEEFRQFRSQFHYFFYRRPGSDYVAFRTIH